MSETPVEVKVVQQQQPHQSTWERIKTVMGRSKPETTLKESDRFSRLGYLKYPIREQLDFRLSALMDILDGIEKKQEELEKAKTTKSRKRSVQAQIRDLFKAFTIIGAPWFEGLDNRELAAKAVTFSKLEKMITDGNLTAYFSDLKSCAETLIYLSFRAKHVIPDTPVLMETKTNVLAPHGGINLGEENVKRPGRTEET